MKQELKDFSLQLLYGAPTTVYAVVSKVTVAEWVAIILGVLQAIYLLRKWWREETAFGLWLKRRAHKDPGETDPDDLGAS